VSGRERGSYRELARVSFVWVGEMGNLLQVMRNR
jgi:hypothetical protein